MPCERRKGPRIDGDADVRLGPADRFGVDALHADWLSFIALIAAIALLSYIFGYLASQIPERPGADSKLPRKQGRDDLG